MVFLQTIRPSSDVIITPPKHFVFSSPFDTLSSIPLLMFLYSRENLSSIRRSTFETLSSMPYWMIKFLKSELICGNRDLISSLSLCKHLGKHFGTSHKRLAQTSLWALKELTFSASSNTMFCFVLCCSSELFLTRPQFLGDHFIIENLLVPGFHFLHARSINESTFLDANSSLSFFVLLFKLI